MTKIEFCYELFRYISNGLNELILETNDFTYSLNINKDNVFIGQEYFIIIDGLSDFKIKYNNVKSISEHKELS